MSKSSTQDRQPLSIGDAGQFAMELAGLVGIGLIGWHLGNEGIFGAVLAIAFIFLTGTVWGRYRTPGYVPTGREPTHPVSGPVRIAIELVVYTLGIFGIWWSGREQTAYIVIGIMVLTLIISYKRLIGLWFTRV